MSALCHAFAVLNQGDMKSRDFSFRLFLYDAELKRAQVIVTLLRESHQQDAADAEVKKD